VSEAWEIEPLERAAWEAWLAGEKTAGPGMLQVECRLCKADGLRAVFAVDPTARRWPKHVRDHEKLHKAVAP